MQLHSRRKFLSFVSAAAAVGCASDGSAMTSEPPPEVEKLRLAKVPGVCVAPEYVAEELLHAEGFEDITYVPVGAGVPMAEAVARSEIDLCMNFVAALVAFMDVSANVTILAGVHSGCFDL